MSVLFETGNHSSGFLASLGLDPANSPSVADMLSNLTSNEELALENTHVDLSEVRISNFKAAQLISNPEEYVMYEGSLT